MRWSCWSFSWVNSAHCSRCVCCVCSLLCVCTWMGQMQRTHFTAGYTLYNCVWQKKKKYIYIYIYIYIGYLFFQNRYPIMVKCLNIGKNIGKPIYRSISSLKSSFQMKVNLAFNLEIKVPESGGRVERHRIHISSVKFPQSVMIWAAMASAGVGPMCFLKSSQRSHLPGNFRALHASFSW